MEKIKNYLLAFLSGAVVVLLWIVIYLLKNAKPVINAEQYIDQMEQRVGKIKQRGEGNNQVTDLDQTLEPGTNKKEIRRRIRRLRKLKRKTK